MEGSKWQKLRTASEFHVVFEGEAVKDYLIDVDKFANTMIGVSNALQEFNRVSNGNTHSKISVKIKANFKESSFLVELILFMTSTNIGAVTNIATLIGFCGYHPGSLIQLYKKTKGEVIAGKREISDGKYELTFDNCSNPIIINGPVVVADWYGDSKVRKSMNQIADVFRKKGIETLRFSDNMREAESISRAEASYFEVPEDDAIEEKIDTDYFLVTRPDFEGRKTGWRFSFGTTNDIHKKTSDFPAKVLDEKFLSDVKVLRTLIPQGTVIKAKYRKITHRIGNLRVQWEILEVLEVGLSKSVNRSLSDF